jgi:hypothetical protein
MKVGDIALSAEGVLWKITRLETKKIPITKTVKTGWFSSREEETGEIKEEIDRVWWCPIGEEWKGRETSNALSCYYDWDKMIVNARLIIKQVELLKTE